MQRFGSIEKLIEREVLKLMPEKVGKGKSTILGLDLLVVEVDQRIAVALSQKESNRIQSLTRILIKRITTVKTVVISFKKRNNSKGDKS